MTPATTPVATRDATLHRLLDAGSSLPPEYANQLSNHLPMALHALAELGASGERLQQFADRYARRFEGRTAVRAAAVDDWLPLRGQADSYAALHATFAAALAREGRDAVLRAALPALWPGVAAAAFHGVIRTAHAVQAGHDAELAAALAYWAWRWQALSPIEPGPPMDVQAWCERLLEAGRALSFPGSLISLRMAHAAQSAPYRELAGRLQPTPDLPSRLWAFAAGRYADTRNFTVLHMVTGVRAVRVLLPWAHEHAAVLREAVAAFTAAYLSAATPAQTLPAPPALDWPTIAQRAIASDDDHVIKLVHACRAAAQAGVAGRFIEAAARAVA
jgi:hypothetical protein